MKNIPEGVNKRLSSTSSSKEIFDKAVPLFQEAINKSGYNYTLKFDPPKEATPPKRKNTCRKRNILWFNPTYNSSVKTNVGHEVLKLVSKCFPKGHPLSKILNKKTIKVSYSTTNNVQEIIASRNAKILRKQETPTRNCNSRGDTPCPLMGKCLEKNIFYNVTLQDGTQRNYVGLSSSEFKARLAVHETSFK